MRARWSRVAMAAILPSPDRRHDQRAVTGAHTSARMRKRPWPAPVRFDEAHELPVSVEQRQGEARAVGGRVAQQLAFLRPVAEVDLPEPGRSRGRRARVAADESWYVQRRTADGFDGRTH